MGINFPASTGNHHGAVGTIHGMRHTLIALIMLTQLDGSPVWVESTHVQIIKTKPAQHECGPSVGSIVAIGSRVMCVKEKSEQVREKIEGGKR